MAIGANDQTVPPAMAEEACLHMPHAQMAMQNGLGHLAHEQDPENTVQQILQWCESTCAAAAN
jgi:magnesium chelatase accessory protein